jgi:hypothetical protein
MEVIGPVTTRRVSGNSRGSGDERPVVVSSSAPIDHV